MSEPEKTGKSALKDPKTGKFLKGHPGIGGRPLGLRSMLSAINSRMDKPGPDGKTPCFEVTADNITQKILDGEAGWDKLYMEYLDGKPKEHKTIDLGLSKSLASLLKNAFNIEGSEEGDSSESE